MSRQLRPLLKNFNGKNLTDFKALLEAGAVGFSDDGIPLESSKIVKEAMEEAKKLNTFISLHEEDPGLNGVLALMKILLENISISVVLLGWLSTL